MFFHIDFIRIRRIFRQLFDPETSTYTYLLADEQTREAVLIEPVREQVARDASLVHELGLTLRYALDTHVHADHVTGLGSLRERTGAKTVQAERAAVGCSDVLAKQGDVISFGKYGVRSARRRATPTAASRSSRPTGRWRSPATRC